MSARTVLYVTLIISVTALGIGILALFLPETTIIVNGGNTILLEPLSVYDNQAQAVDGANQWTNVAFNTHLFTSSSWVHTLGSSSITCNRTGFYSVYFGIQAQLNVSTIPAETPFACVACHMRYMIRAIQERDTDEVIEVPGSSTYANGDTLFLAKNFYINAVEGDIFRFQFLSTCPHFTLYPLSHLQPSLPVEPVADLFPSSAVLLIA